MARSPFMLIRKSLSKENQRLASSAKVPNLVMYAATAKALAIEQISAHVTRGIRNPSDREMVGA